MGFFLFFFLQHTKRMDTFDIKVLLLLNLH